MRAACGRGRLRAEPVADWRENAVDHGPVLACAREVEAARTQRGSSGEWRKSAAQKPASGCASVANWRGNRNARARAAVSGSAISTSRSPASRRCAIAEKALAKVVPTFALTFALTLVSKDMPHT